MTAGAFILLAAMFVLPIFFFFWLHAALWKRGMIGWADLLLVVAVLAVAVSVLSGVCVHDVPDW